MRTFHFRRSRWVTTIAGSALVAVAALGFSSTALVFKATFTGVADGPGNGVSFPTEAGSLRTFCQDPLGRSFATVAPGSGIVGERLRLTDAGGDSTVDFGVQLVPLSSSPGPLTLTFQFRIDVPGTSFSIDILDSGGIDISRVQFGDGGINPEAPPAPAGSPLDFAVDMTLVPLLVSDLLVTTVSNATTGQVLLVYTEVIPGGVRPVGAVNFTKLGTRPGAFTVDSLRIQVQ